MCSGFVFFPLDLQGVEGDTFLMGDLDAFWFNLLLISNILSVYNLFGDVGATTLCSVFYESTFFIFF